MPDPAKDRLKNRHEHILHLRAGVAAIIMTSLGMRRNTATVPVPADVWRIGLRRDVGRHLAPFPDELVDRVMTLACPRQVCSLCGTPRRRIVQRTTDLDPARPQAKRAMELAAKVGLRQEHILAIQATGISDAGKAMKTQNGTGRNSDRIKELAGEAKALLGGYFREFTFAKRTTVGWTECGCKSSFRPGIVLDPFMGTGTTLRAALAAGLSSIGADLCPSQCSNDALGRSLMTNGHHNTGYVVGHAAIRRAIGLLAARRSHEHLPGYFALLRHRLSSTPIGARAIATFYDDYLRIRDAPPRQALLTSLPISSTRSSSF